MNGIETLKDEFCSDESFEEIKERKVEKIRVTVEYFKSVQKKDITEHVISEKLSAKYPLSVTGWTIDIA